MSTLEGKTILIVEDDFLLALNAQEILESLGARIVGPASRVEEALERARHDDFDTAMLDVNIRGKPVTPVAEALQARDIPFVFTTGYGESPFGRDCTVPLLGKPYTETMLERAFARAMEQEKNP